MTTSDENREVVDEVYAAFLRGDVSAVAARFSEEARVDFEGASTSVPWHLPARSRADLPRFFAAFTQSVDIELFEREATLASNEEVVARVRLRYRVRNTGARVEERQVHWWWLKDGQVQAMTHFEDTAQVIAAVRGANEVKP